MSRRGRWRLAACCAAVAAVVLAAGPQPLIAIWAALLVGALWCCAVWPRAGAAAVVGVCGLAVLAAPQLRPLTNFDGAVDIILPAAVAFVVARVAGGVPGFVAAVAVAGASLAIGLEDRPQDSWVPYVMPAAAGWVAGRAVRVGDLLARQLAQRAEELEHEREAFSELSVRYERSRIAAELHDIVAHAISVMVVQASAGQRIAGRDPAAAAAALGHIADAGRQAQADVDRLVAMLADGAEDGSPPDLELVSELVASGQRTGLDVTLRLEGERHGFAAEASRCAYLVVREGITNALRYAAGATVEVVVSGAPCELIVAVRNSPAAGPMELGGLGAGTGLLGLRERLARVGGRLDAGPTADGGWLIEATLPRRPSQAPLVSA